MTYGYDYEYSFFSGYMVSCISTSVTMALCKYCQKSNVLQITLKCLLLVLIISNFVLSFSITSMYFNNNLKLLALMNHSSCPTVHCSVHVIWRIFLESRFSTRLLCLVEVLEVRSR